MTETIVIIGVRGFGLACGRRMGVGRRVILGDIDAGILEATRQILVDEGYDVDSCVVDITDRVSLDGLAKRAAQAGRMHSLVLTAGLSPHMAEPERIFAVNMLGTINVMASFLPLAKRGSTAVVIASNAGYLAPVPPEVERKLALDPPDTLMDVVKQVPGWDSGLGAYWLSKRANHLRIEAAAPLWGKQGARILTVSPGIMSTAMTKIEQGAGSPIAEAVANNPTGRIGTPEDIAIAVDWLSSPQAGYITGTDILVDGGMTSALRWTDFSTDNPAG